MLAEPEGGGVATTFHQRYADISERLALGQQHAHDTTKYPSFTPGSYNAAMAELDSFFADVVVNGGTFKDLFLSPTGSSPRTRRASMG